MASKGAFFTSAQQKKQKILAESVKAPSKQATDSAAIAAPKSAEGYAADYRVGSLSNSINNYISNFNGDMDHSPWYQKGFDAASFFEERRKEAEAIRAEAADAERYFNRNWNVYTPEGMDYFKKFLSDINSSVDDILGRYESINTGMAENPDAFAYYQKEYQMRTADLDALQKELDELNAQYDNYQYDASTFRGRMAAEADLQRMEKEISDRQQYLNQARRIQDGVRMASVSQNADFGQKSGYQAGITDPVYEYVNDVNGARLFMDRSHNPAIKAAYDQMTDEEIANYNYHYATGGQEQAQRYLDTLAETLNQRKGEQMSAGVQGQTAKELLFAAGAGLNQAAEGFRNLFSSEDYIAPSAYQYASGMVREDLADNGFRLPQWMGGASLGQMAYDLVNTGANMLPSMAVGVINPVAGAALMGASAAGGAYQEALNSGYTKEQARTYSALVGGSEAGLEYLLGGISSLGGIVPEGVVNKILKGVDNAFARFAIQMGGSMVGEGFEEGLQEVLTPYFQNLALLANEDVNWEEVAYSSLLGALSGGLMEAPGTAIDSIRYAANQRRAGAGSSSGSSSGGSVSELTRDGIQAKVSADGRGRIISTNAEADANDFHSIKGGEATIQLKDGSSAPMDDMTFANQEEAARFLTIRSLPGIETEAANDLYHAMADNNSGSDVDTIAGVRDAYGFGYYGYDKADASKNGADASKLSPELRNAAFEAGQKQRAMDAAAAPRLSKAPTVKPSKGYKKVVFEGKVNIAKGTRADAEVRFMDYIAENFSGANVHVYQSRKGVDGKRYYFDSNGKRQLAPNGRYVNDELWIDLNSGDKGEGLALNTFAHEMYHHVEKWNKKGAHKLAEFVVKELGMESVESAVSAQIKKATAAGYGVEYFKKYGNNGKGMTEEQAINIVEQRAMSDFVADALETMFTRGNPQEAIARLKQEDRGLFDQIKAFIDEWVGKLKQWYSDKTISQEGKKIAEIERFEELQKLFMEAMAEAGSNYNAAVAKGIDEKSTTPESDAMYQARTSVKDPSLLDPRTVTRTDVLEMLRNVVAGEYYDNTYIPVRIGTPSTLIYWAKERRNDIIDDNPIAMSAGKAYQAMARAGEDIDGTPHELSPENVVAIIEKMNEPEYIVYQGSNGRYAEVISYESQNGKKAIAILEIGDYKDKPVMNGFESGMYNIFVTTYPPNRGKVAELLENKKNKVIYNKKKDAPRGTSSSTVPSVSNDASFFEDIVPQPNEERNTEMNSLRNATGDIHEVRRKLADAFDAVAKTVLEKKRAGEYREKIAKAEALDSDLKIANREIMELGKAKTPTEKARHSQLRRDINRMRTELDEVNKQIRQIEILKSFREQTQSVTDQYSKSMLQQMREMQKENIQQQILADRITREELTGKDSDITIMEKEFIRIAKAYEKLDAKTGKKITDLREALKTEAEAHKEDSKIWQREFNRLLREYEASGRKIQRLEDTIARQRATAKARVQSRRNTELRNKIQKKARELNNILLHGSKHRNVPEMLQPAVAEILDAINMEIRDGDSRRKTYEATLLRYDQRIAAETDPAKVSELIEKRNAYAAKGDQFAGRVAKLKNAYDNIRKNKIPGLEIDAGLSDLLDTLFERVGDTPLGQMTSAQLEAVNDVLKITKATIVEANKLFQEGQKAGVEENSQSAMAEVRSAGGVHKLTLPVVGTVMEFSWNNLKPVYAMETIGSKVLKDLYENVRRGEDTLGRNLAEGKAFFQKQWKEYGGRDWDMEKKYRFESTSGKEFQLDLNQIMSIYALSKREQARSHLRNGGFSFESRYKTKEDVKVGPVTLKVGMESTDASAYNLSDEILGEIISKLSPQQRAFVDKMQGYLSNEMAAKGNEISLKKYGIRLFKEQNYFPLRVADQYMAKKREQQTGDRKLKNSGFTKEVTPEAKNPVVLGGFLDVWGEHVDEMSMYNAFVLPLDDFERVLNYHGQFTENGEATSVVEAIRNAYGEGATRYLDNLIRDINGGARTDSVAKSINRMTSKAKKAQTMASLSVAIQQPSAVIRAMAMVDGKYFIGPKVTEMNHGRTWEEMKKYAPVTIIKEMGGFDTNVGQSTVEYLTDRTEYNGFLEKAEGFIKDEKYRDEVLGWLPGYMDELAWGAIWNAVKREQREIHPDMNHSGDAFLRIVSERFTDVITHTQVYDSVFSRSGMMRSKDTAVKMVTSFMAEPTTTANMLYSALVNAKRGGGKVQLGRTVAALAGALALNSALVSLVYAMRDDEEDKRYDEKWIENFRENVLEGLNPATYIPIIRDIDSMRKGFDIDRTDMSLYGDLMNAINGLTDEDRSAWEKVETVMGATGNLLGIPVKNIIRDGKGLFTTIANALDHDDPATRTGRVMAWRGEDLDDGDQLLLAIQRGDEEHIQRVAGRYDSQDAAERALTSAIGNQYREGKLTAEEATELLGTNTGMDADDIYWKLDEWSYARDNGSSDGYLKYGKLVDAVESGNSAEEIQRYLGNGADAGTVRSQITRAYKTAYMEGDEDTRMEIRDKVRPAYEALGTEDVDGLFNSWDFEAQYGMTYTDYKAAFLDGDVSESQMREAMDSYGRMQFQIEEDIRDLKKEKAFQDRFHMSLTEMYEAYDHGDIAKNTLISAMEFSGKTREEAREAVTKRDIENRIGIDYMKLDDAYKYGDISRQTLYDAMIENGATKQEADEAIVGYDWLKKNVKRYPDLTISDAKKFTVTLGEKAPEETLADYGVSVDAYLKYQQLRPECKGVDANGDGKTDSGTLRDSVFRMIDSLPISNEAKDGLALQSYSMSSIKKNAPWH